MRAMPLSGCLQVQLLQQLAKLLAIAGGVERIDGGAEDRHAGFLQAAGEIQRRLAAELDDHAFDQVRRSLIAKRPAVEALADVQNILVRQRLEEQQIAGVVIGADGFGIGIDHHRFEAQFLHRKGGLHAAVIELDSLPDAIGAAADDDDFGFVGEADFVFG